MTSLEQQLLIAMPALNDPNFSQAVIYVCEYNKENGAMGIVINKPMNISLGEVLRHLNISTTDEKVDNYPILRGGPIAQEQGFIIRRSRSSAETPNGEITLSASKQDLAEFANGEGLDDSLVSLGYAGWGAGQLEQELIDNAWLVAPLDMKILFDVPYELRWRRAAASIGVDLDRLSGDSGHA
jgi:putative transcriptional regulator